VTQDQCTYCKETNHKQEGCWFLHPELRPARWIDKSEGRRKGEKDWRWANLSKKEEGSKSFSTGRALSVFDPIQNEMERVSTGPSSEGNKGNTQGGLDLMQAMFKEFSMWYSK
jgi:hypothetical protein